MAVPSSSTAKDTEAHALVEKRVLEHFKKSGKFDAMRRQALRSFEQSSDGLAFQARLEQLVDAELARDPSLAARDRGKAATLVGGAVDRSSCYADARKQAAERIFGQAAFRGEIEEEIRRTMKVQADEAAAAAAAGPASIQEAKKE